MKSTKFVFTRILHLRASGASLQQADVRRADVQRLLRGACHGTEGTGDAPPLACRHGC